MGKDTNEVMGKFLGPLEQRVMQIVWDRGQATVHEVLELLNEQHDYAYTTIMTIMSRLVAKGVLVREQKGRSYLYKPTFTAGEFVEHMSSKVVRELLQDFGDVAIAQFVETVRTDRKQLEKLKKLISDLERGEK